jgi:hypothetical protein
MTTNISPADARRLTSVSRGLQARLSGLRPEARAAALRGIAARTHDPYERALAQQALAVSQAEKRLADIAAEHARLDAMDGSRAVAAERDPRIAAGPDRLGRMQQLAAEHEEVVRNITILAGDAGEAQLRAAAAEAAQVYAAEEAESGRIARIREAAQARMHDPAEEDLIGRLAVAERAKAGLPAVTTTSSSGAD